MNSAFLILVLVAQVAIVIALIKPAWAMPWAQSPRRLPAIGLYAAILVVSFVGFGVTLEDEAAQVAEADAGEAQAEQVAAAEPEATQEPADLETAEAAVEDAPPQQWLDMDRSEEAQAERWALIERAIDMGVIYKVEKPARFPRIYVDSGWDMLRFDEKQNLADAITTYFYAEDHEAKMAIIRDGYSGQDIGRLDSAGLTLH
ncbi:hypothetical protein [Billgrantia ethanolica]|uniref:Uncharacterized protein n=1 Tax=Billgrantia ethanolica TaxID=2733486 RepID=A0ABS9A5W9_9GAMM|nr:hypothetical protein [Halomonas ethanolica]MCE8004219.1 hypothetical protein [Halomonas ethanolica]